MLQCWCIRKQKVQATSADLSLTKESGCGELVQVHWMGRVLTKAMKQGGCSPYSLVKMLGRVLVRLQSVFQL